MTEYITKEQAIDEVWDAFTSRDDPDLGRVIEENIERLPAADVVPVAHAENVANAHPSEEFKCSKCGTYLVDYIELRKVDGVDDFYISEFTDWNFCPKCGARMDGEYHG